jgi:hypothetical protein
MALKTVPAPEILTVSERARPADMDRERAMALKRRVLFMATPVFDGESFIAEANCKKLSECP